MRVAALYDVHGMPWALEAVLEDVEREGVDAVVFGGDLVGGPFPRESLDLARTLPEAVFVRGNGEREPEEFVRGALTAEELAELHAWPESVVLDDVFYCHATPRDDVEIVTDATPDEKLAAILSESDARLVVGGHTHMQQRRGRYLNPGSVGMPYEGEVAAFWALVDAGEPSFRRSVFDVEHALGALAGSAWPDAAEFAADNVRQAVSREAAIAVFGG